MFGYVVVHKDELKIKDFSRYGSYYCGVCRSLRDNYGISGQMTLTYDMTFIAVLLSGLYEDDTPAVMKHCVAHHIKKHPEIRNEYTDYAAAMNVMLSYYKLKDNWEDDKSVKSNLAAGMLKKAYKKAKKSYPDKAGIIERYIKEQHQMEDNNKTDIDTVSGCTGRMLGSLFTMKDDEWKSNLYDMGFYLGKFIYIMDAFDDVEKDIKHNNFNPLKDRAGSADFNEYCKRILNIVAAESAKYFERLPIIQNIDILRNIMYAGIWSRYNKLVMSDNKKLTERDRLEE